MKKSKKIALLSLLLVGVVGIGTASAFIITDAIGKTVNGTTDDGILLEWGETLSVGAITTLNPGTPQYREVSLLAPKKSSGLQQDSGLIATLAPSEGAKIDGISVDIAEDSWAEQSTVAIYTLTSENDSHSIVVNSNVTFYLRIRITDEAFQNYLDDGNEDVMGGTITLSYGLIN